MFVSLTVARPFLALAAQTGQAADWPPQSGIGSLIAVVLALGFVIVLIMLLVRFLATRNQFWSRTGAIRHLGGIGVGQQKSVQLVQIGKKLYVIGVGNDVRLLDKIEDEEEIREITASLPSAGFMPDWKWLGGLRGTTEAGSRGGTRGTDGEELDASRFQHLLDARIRELAGRSGRLKERPAEDEEADGKRP
jgi:flagellar protein FliO/FliZ